MDHQDVTAGPSTVPALPGSDSTAATPSQPARWEHFDDIEAYAPLNTEKGIIDFIEAHRISLARFCVIARKPENQGLDPDDPKLYYHLRLMKSFVKWLSTIDITPTIYNKHLETLHELLNTPTNRFPAFIVQYYNAIEQGWRDINYGADYIDDDEGNQNQAEEASSAGSMAVAHGSNDVFAQNTAGYPRDDDPIWGLNGIMHGVLRRSNPIVYTLDTRFEKREACIFGHNGLQPGEWLPLQTLAIFRGAHGTKQAGIHHRTNEGVYSIVVGSSRYEDMDKDEGDVIWYSGSKSHENRHPTELDDSHATKSLLYSLNRSDRPVRVLRKSNDKNIWAPQRGFRYDGLYAVVSWRRAKNALGGAYRQFKLERLPVDPGRSGMNPCSLEEARDKAARMDQIGIYSRVQQGYVPRSGN